MPVHHLHVPLAHFRRHLLHVAIHHRLALVLGRGLDVAVHRAYPLPVHAALAHPAPRRGGSGAAVHRQVGAGPSHAPRRRAGMVMGTNIIRRGRRAGRHSRCGEQRGEDAERSVVNI